MRNLLFSLVAFIAFIPLTTFAQEYLVNLPIGETATFNDYINAVYLMFISIAALIAVVKIIIAGVKYMFSDIVTQKSDAKRDIQGALLGLLVVLAAVLILTVINPDLTNFNPQITGIQPRELPQSPSGSTGDDPISTIEEYCATNGGCSPENCTLTRGLYLSSLETRCAEWCTDERGGTPLPPTVQGGAPRCLVSPDTTTDELATTYMNNIINDQEFCGPAGCSNFECNGSCTECLTGHGGRVVPYPNRAALNQCIVPRFNLANGPITIPCLDADGNPTSSCRLTTRLCEGDSYGDYSEGAATDAYVDTQGRYVIDCSAR